MFKRFFMTLIVLMMVFPVVALAADDGTDVTFKAWAVANIELILSALGACLIPIISSLFVSFTSTPSESASEMTKTFYSWIEKAAIMWFKAKDTGSTS